MNFVKKKSVLITLSLVMLMGIFFMVRIGIKNNKDSDLKFQENNSYIAKGQDVKDDLKVNVVENENLVVSSEPLEEVIQTEYDFHGDYVDEYGEDAVHEAKIASVTALGLWLADEVNSLDEIEAVATPSFIEWLQELQMSKVSEYQRDVNNVEAVATMPNNEYEMRFTLFANWRLVDSAKVFNTQKKMYYANVKNENGHWLVNSIEGLEDIINNK